MELLVCAAAAYAPSQPVLRAVLPAAHSRSAPPRLLEELDAISELKRQIRACAEIGGAADASVESLVAELERAALDDELGRRPAASPLVDGRWETLFATERPGWTSRWPLGRPPPHGRKRRGLTHEIRGGYETGTAGEYTQRACGRLGLSRTMHARWTELGGDAWSLSWHSSTLAIAGVRLWRDRALRAEADFDYLRPTFVDGDMLVLHSAAILADGCELRPARTYVLGRLRHPLWNGDGFVPPPPSWMSAVPEP